MVNCLNCGKELVHIEGRRKKSFCSSRCKNAYHFSRNKNPKYVQFKSFQELKVKLDEVMAENEKLKTMAVDKATKKDNTQTTYNRQDESTLSKENKKGEMAIGGVGINTPKEKKEPPAGLKGVELLIWKAENQ